jgi:hypothetical protein
VNGLLATFDSVHALEKAARSLHALGVKGMEAFTPFAWEPLDELFPRERDETPLGRHFASTNLPGLSALVAAVVGGTTVFATLTLAETWSNPFDAGGRPLYSWPLYIPITFVLTVLSAGITLFLGYFWSMRLPEPHHPLFELPAFRMNENHFHLFLSSTDPLFEKARALLHGAQLTEVHE